MSRVFIAFQNFMSQDMVSMSLLVALVALQPFTKSLASLNLNVVSVDLPGAELRGITSVVVPDIITYYWKSAVVILVITVAPIVLLLESVDSQKGERRGIVVHVLE
jgi:hypothetical protein